MGCRCTIKKPLRKCIIMMAISAVLVLAFLCTRPAACVDTPCPDGRLCPANWTCCEVGCCAPTTPHAHPRDLYRDHGFMDHPWYAQWPVLFLLGILGGILICCTWFCFCKRYTTERVLAVSCACCLRPLRPSDERDSAGSLYPPPHYSRCGSFHQAPPPYSEVQSKPDLYPLVITCADGEGKAGGNYVMVQYFRNYVIRPPGSISATSTAESLNSSFICQATNEANTIIPPPYSCANGTYDDIAMGGCARVVHHQMSPMPMQSMETEIDDANPRPVTARTRDVAAPDSSARDVRDVRDYINRSDLHQRLLDSPILSEDDIFDINQYRFEVLEGIYGNASCKPKVGESPGHRPSPPSNFRTNFNQDSFDEPELGNSAGVAIPIPLSSPTGSPSYGARRPVEEKRALDSLRRAVRKASLYVPLSATQHVRAPRAPGGARASSRSAPATPSSNLVPNLVNFTQRVSSAGSRHGSRSSRLEEENDPLLTESENQNADHKF